MKNIYTALLIFLFNKAIAQQSCQWAYIPTGTNAYHTINYSAIDNSGNIIQVGRMLGVADMDPGTAPTDTSFSPGGYGYYLSKTSISGHLIWVKYFSQQGIGGMFEFRGVKVNSANEIIVAGNFFGLVDFDLSANGVDTLRSHFPTYPDYFLAKYDDVGNHQWAFNIGNPTTSNIEAESFCLRSNDDIVICANPSGGALIDVDPGPAVHHSIGFNANLICYNTNGNYLWNNHISVTYSYANDYKSVDCDASGNVYLLSVGYYELTVTKFNSSGTELWNKTIGNFTSQSRVNPQSVLVDKATGSFYVAGTFGGTVDFDPGSPTVTASSTTFTYQDAFLAKYDDAMNLLWLNPYHGNISFGLNGIDFSGTDIIAAGTFTGTVNFGLGNPLTVAQFSPFYIKVDAAGNALETYMLTAAGGYKSIHGTSTQSFVAMGNLNGNADMDPTTATLNLTSPSGSNDFTAVYGTVPTSSHYQNFNTPLNIFPNPADKELLIQTSFTQQIQLFNVSGKTILSQKILPFQKNKIATGNLSNGIYFIKIGNHTSKIAVLHQ